MFPLSAKTAAGRFKPPAALIHIRERYFIMLKADLLLRNPVQFLGDPMGAGHFGGVLARAGVGKTALMVQIALYAMLNDRNVLHVSLNQPVNKTSLWYREVFGHVARQANVPPSDPIWESLLPHRFIMTFREDGFSVPKLEERLTDLLEQNIFVPNLLIIDGMSFEAPLREPLSELKKFARLHGLGVWFSIRTHRHEEPGPGGIPKQLADVEDLFEAALQLVPVSAEIQVKALKGLVFPSGQSELVLDPTTMLAKDRAA
jgi:hypothetical protein